MDVKIDNQTYVIISDCNGCEVCEPYMDDNPREISMEIADYCYRREVMVRRALARRRDELCWMVICLAVATVPVLVLLHWCLIGY